MPLEGVPAYPVYPAYRQAGGRQAAGRFEGQERNYNIFLN